MCILYIYISANYLAKLTLAEPITNNFTSKMVSLSVEHYACISVIEMMSNFTKYAAMNFATNYINYSMLHKEIKTNKNQLIL